jgi:hypothetical protein
MLDHHQGTSPFTRSIVNTPVASRSISSHNASCTSALSASAATASSTGLLLPSLNRARSSRVRSLARLLDKRPASTQYRLAVLDSTGIGYICRTCRTSSMAPAEKLYPRATVKRIIKAHSAKNLSKNVDVLVSRCLSFDGMDIAMLHPSKAPHHHAPYQAIPLVPAHYPADT